MERKDASHKIMIKKSKFKENVTSMKNMVQEYIIQGTYMNELLY